MAKSSGQEKNPTAASHLKCNIGAVPLLEIRVSVYILNFFRKDAQGH
ncbi:MAG: hypothetical protein VB125_03475 [Burkholderia sp.]